MHSVSIPKIIQLESSFRPHVVHPVTGAVGLMQITEPVLRDYNFYHKTQYMMTNLTDPLINLKIGSWYVEVRIPQILASIHVPDSVLTKLIAYNWGCGHLEDWYLMLPVETRDYIRKYCMELKL